MRTVFPPKKPGRTPTVRILLIVAVLVVGAAACDGAGARTYELTISGASGGSVSTPGAGTFTYDAGTVVQLMATSDDGYQFLSWTGDIASIANPNAASTSITMTGNCAIVANFEMVESGEPAPGGGGPYS
jgi:hypothetical protein